MTTTANSASTKKSAVLEVNLSPEWRASLEAYAAHEGVTVESVIQDALAEYVTKVKIEVEMPQCVLDAATLRAQKLGISFNTYINRLVHSSLAA